MTNGANHSGAISFAGEQDLWTFTANVGDSIALSLGEVAPLTSFNPWMRLRDPNGLQVGSDPAFVVSQLNVVAAIAGTYTVLVSDGSSGHDLTGSYLLTLAKTPGAFVVPGGDEGGAMTNGANHQGAIHLGDIDQWTFRATSGHALSVSIGEVAPETSFTPWIRLRARDGTQVGSSLGSSAQINVTASTTGTFTVVVTDGSAGNAQIGNYLLTVTGADPNLPPFTDDPLVVGVTPIRAIHVTELRARIDAARGRYGLGAFTYSDSIAAGTSIRASHIVEMRTALAQAYANVPMTAPTYTDPSLAAGMPIKAIHITELRLALQTIE